MPNNLKGYDANQVLRSVFDVDGNFLRVSVIEAESGGGTFEVVISHTNDSIRLGDGTSLVTTTTIGPKVGLDVNVINQIDIRNLTATRDNVAIHDSSGDELQINPNGSINVNGLPSENVSGLFKYNAVPIVASGIETTIVSHTAVGGRKTYLQAVSGSGENISVYRVKINGVEVELKRTYWGDGLNINFIFNGYLNPGIELTIGDIVSLTAIHQRPNVSDYNGKILYVEVI
jgi:hypothetical protein